MKWLDVKTDEGDVLHFSPLTSGLEGVAALLKTRLSPRIYESAPDTAQAAVELMARGAAAALLYSSATPEALLATRVAADDAAASCAPSTRGSRPPGPRLRPRPVSEPRRSR